MVVSNKKNLRESPTLIVRKYRCENPQASCTQMIADLAHYAFNTSTLRTQYSRQKPVEANGGARAQELVGTAKAPKPKRELKNGQIGQAGEHFVNAELIRRGWLATIIHGNSPIIDIMASKGDQSIQVQVKTTSTGHRGAYPLKPSSFRTYVKYIFVSIENDLPRYFIVPGVELSQLRYEIGNDGRVNAKLLNKYENRWDLLEI